MRIIFFSDVHLGAFDEYNNRRKKFLDFLESEAALADRIVINGDLFDFWFEYRQAIPRGLTDVLSHLYLLSRKGIEIHYVPGNHDFWMCDFFQQELGIILHSEIYDFTSHGKKIHVFHGDGIAGNDVGYRIMKKIFRFRPNIWLYRWLHPDLGIPLAKSISHTSRMSSRNKELLDESDYRNYALKKGQEGFQIVILGHRHVPVMENLGSVLYINLGDWIEHFSYAVFQDGEIVLKRYQG